MSSEAMQILTNGDSVNVEKLPNTARNNLYKTELCKHFMEVGTCRYSNKCQFAHGYHELRGVLRHPKYKTTACKAYSVTGTCVYGNRCRFIHEPLMEDEMYAEDGPPVLKSRPALKHSQSVNLDYFSTSFTRSQFEPSTPPLPEFDFEEAVGEIKPAAPKSRVLKHRNSQPILEYASPILLPTFHRSLSGIDYSAFSNTDFANTDFTCSSDFDFNLCTFETGTEATASTTSASDIDSPMLSLYVSPATLETKSVVTNESKTFDASPTLNPTPFTKPPLESRLSKLSLFDRIASNEYIDEDHLLPASPGLPTSF